MKVLISGAGLGGLACAIACKREGIDVQVLERTSTLSAVSNQYFDHSFLLLTTPQHAQNSYLTGRASPF